MTSGARYGDRAECKIGVNNTRLEEYVSMRCSHAHGERRIMPIFARNVAEASISHRGDNAFHEALPALIITLRHMSFSKYEGLV